MKRALVLAILVILVAGLGAADEAADTGPGTTSSEQITQTVSLQPGWNSVSFKVTGLTFTEDIKPQCSFNWYNQELAEGASADEISDDDRYHVWTQEAGEWSHPDNLDVSEGYSFNVDSECEFEVSGERERIDSFELEDGWNLVNVPSGLALGQIKDECNLRWYSQELASGTSSDEISEDERRFFWVNDGNSWRDPYEEKDHRGDDGVYINSNGDCEINSWPYDGKESDVQDEEDSGTQTNLGEIYFAEDDNILVSSKENSEYEMYDNQIEGRFYSEIEDWRDGDRTLIVENLDTGVKRSYSDNTEVISVPPDDGYVFNMEESGFGELGNDGTSFSVILEHENDKLEKTFTFYPSDSIADWEEDVYSLNEGQSIKDKLGSTFQQSGACKSNYNVKFTDSQSLVISTDSKEKIVGSPSPDQVITLDNFKVTVNQRSATSEEIEFTPECK